MTLQPPGGSALDAVDPSVLVYAVGGVVVFSVLTMLTRSLLLRSVWQVGRVACALYPALLAWQWWSIDDPTGTITAGSVPTAQVPDWLTPGLPSLSLAVDPRPPTDPEIALLVVAVGLVAFFLLNLRLARSRAVAR